IDDQAKLAAPVPAATRSAFQKSVVQLQANLVLYQRLKYSLISPESSDFLGELTRFQQSVETGVTAIRARQAGEPHDEAAAQDMIDFGQRYIRMSQAGFLLAVPPA